MHQLIMNIFRKTKAFLLLFFMLFCMIKNTALLSLYELNQDLFITILCENKSKPTLKCNGKCQLSKISAEQQQEQAAQVLNHLQADIFFFHEESLISNANKFLTDITLVYNPMPNNHYQSPSFAEDDKPPTI